jgi:hypothetical protein
MFEKYSFQVDGRKTVFSGKRKRNKIRIAAFAVCVLFIAAMVLLSAYILENSGHTHDHDGLGGCCSTCMQIQAAENTLRTLSVAIAATGLTFVGLFGTLLFIKSKAKNIPDSSLVALKVKLSL